MKRFYYLVLITGLILLSACSGRNQETVASTGYPSEEVQRPAVFYTGYLYFYTAEGFDLPLADGFEKAGVIKEVNNNVYPSEEFHASRVETGQEIYADEDDKSKIFVKYEDGYAPFYIEETEKK